MADSKTRKPCGKIERRKKSTNEHLTQKRKNPLRTDGNNPRKEPSGAARQTKKVTKKLVKRQLRSVHNPKVR